MAVEGLILDLDDTLYHMPDGAATMCLLASIQAIAGNGGAKFATPDAVLSEINRLPSWRDNDFSDFIEHHSLDREAVLHDYHVYALDLFAPYLVPDAEQIAALEPYKGRIVVATHATRTAWTDPVLNRLGLNPLIPADHILTIEDPRVKHQRKHLSDVMYRAALGILDLPPEKAAMVDDNMDNLVFPKRAGSRTISVSWGEAVNRPSHVDEIHDNLTAYLNSLNGGPRLTMRLQP